MSLLKFVFSKSFLKQLVFAGVFCVIAVVVLWFGMNIYTGHQDFVEVPDVKGLTLTEAIEGLEKQQLAYLVVDSIWNEGSIGGTILEQNPTPASKVKKDRKVYLTVFKHQPEAVKLDIEEGLNYKIAQIKLRNKGIPFETIHEPNVLLHDMVVRVRRAGTVLRPEALVKPGEELELVIGRRGDEKVGVPDVKGMSLDSARFTLSQSNLSLGQAFYNADIESVEDSLLAKVYMQMPGPSDGEAVRIGSNVDVYLSTEYQKPEVKKSLKDRIIKKETP